MTVFERIRVYGEHKHIFETLSSRKRAHLVAMYAVIPLDEANRLTAKEQSKVIFSLLYGPRGEEIMARIRGMASEDNS